MTRPLSNRIEHDRERRKPGWALLIASLLVFLCWTMGLALEPPTPEQIEEYRRDGTLDQRIEAAKAFGNHLVSPQLSARAAYRLNRLFLESQGADADEIDRVMAPPPAWRGLRTYGTVKVLALLISFSDYPHHPDNTAASIASKLFGNGNGGEPYESLRNYYLRSSYNQLDIQGNVLGWYTPSYSRDSMGNPDETHEAAVRETLIKEALTYYNGLEHDFSQYDNNGDGKIDYFIVIWTGPHGDWSSFWWGYQTNFTDHTFTLDGKTLGKYSWQWEAYNYPGTIQDPAIFEPKTVIHETGHGLGLPDYYDYNAGVGPKGGVGDLDMMDGNWGDHNCFSKFLLDWISPAAYTSGTRTVTLSTSGTTRTDNAVVVMPTAVQGNAFAEFFMVQNRYRAGNDADPAKPYPNDGLLIWHVDARLNGSSTDFLYNNSDASHKLLRLMEADGLEEIEKGGSANAGDYYTAGKSFGKTTVPNSNNYNAVATGISVGGISASGPTMSFTLSLDPIPQMNLKAGSASLLSGTGSLDLGYVVLGRPRDAVFTVENLGDGALHLTGSPIVQVAGTNASDFAVVAGPATTVAAGGSTSFTLRFTPSSAGAKTAALSIANDDPARNPYAITLTGTGRPLYSFPFSDDFSTDKGWLGYEPGGWTRGPATAGGGEYGKPDPSLDHTATSDNYLLGFALGADYPNNLSEKAIVSPAIDCTGRNVVKLAFWRWLNVEENGYNNFPPDGLDHARIYVGTDGLTWSQVWENPAQDVTDNAWTQVVYDISAYAGNQSSVYIKFTMGPTDLSWRFSGWNIDDLAVTSTDDITPPAPDPMTWASVPTAAGTASVSMTATTASDTTGPVSYFFDFTDSPSLGTGGTDSGWQASTSYTNAGLQANHQYGYRVKAKDGAGNETQYSTPTRYVYTAIETPSGIGFDAVTSGSIQARSANTPSGLTFGSSALLVENTTTATNSGWKHNNDPWTNGSLSPNTGYSFRAKARNGDGVETAYSAAAVKYTLANAPAPGVFSNVTPVCIRPGWGPNGNSAGTQYYAENQTVGTNSGWATGTGWDSCNLSCGTTYSFRVKAKNGEAVETGWTSLGSQSTGACDTTLPGNPVGLTVSPNTWTHVNTFNATWTNPADPSGIAAAWYRMGSPPTSSTDGTRVAGSGIQALSGLAAPAEGETALYVWLEDGAGNKDHGNRGQAALRYDATVPVNPGSATEGHGLADNTWQNTVGSPSFTWTGASDAGSGVKGYYWYWGADPAGDPVTWTTVPGCSPGAAASGATYLRVRTEDQAGNRSAPVTLFTFKYDNQPPANPTVVVETHGGADGTWQNSVGDPAFAWAGASDANSGVKGYYWSFGTDPAVDPAVWTAAPECNPPAVSSGTYYLRVKTEDQAGNRSAGATLFTLKFDGDAPTAGTMAINGGSPTTNMLVVSLGSLGASDPSGISQMRFSNSAGGPWSSPEAYAPTRAGWVLSDPAYGGNANPGQKAVYVKYRDGAGNWSVPFSAAITYQTLYVFPFEDDFSTDKGWVGYETGKWERGPALAGSSTIGYPDPDADHTSTGDDMILGFVIGGDYPDGLTQEMGIVSPPIDCTGHDRVLLTYWRHLNVQARPYDRAAVYASSNGTVWTQVWENPEEDLTDDAWTFVVHDISGIAANEATAYVKFAMGPTDGSTHFSGWNIDDLALTSDAIYPAEGTLGTEITLWGSGFGVKKGKVLVGSLAATVSSWSDGEIVAVLKKAASPDSYGVTVQPKGIPPVAGKYEFEISPPRIRSLDPEFGSPGEPITLRGMFFGTKGKNLPGVPGQRGDKEEERQIHGVAHGPHHGREHGHIHRALRDSFGTPCVLSVVNTVGTAVAAEPFLID